jgi:hypothetical protein
MISALIPKMDRGARDALRIVVDQVGNMRRCSPNGHHEFRIRRYRKVGVDVVMSHLRFLSVASLLDENTAARGKDIVDVADLRQAANSRRTAGSAYSSLPMMR